MKENEILTLHDDNGVEQTFMLLRTLSLDGEYYMFLLPVSDEDDSDEKNGDDVLILHLDLSSPKEASYNLVTDESLIDRLVELFQKEDNPSTSLDELLDDLDEETDD